MFIRVEEVKKLLDVKKSEIQIIEEFIKSANFNDYQYDEKIDLNENIFFRKMKYNLKTERTFKLENHHDMIDVHYSLKGNEKMFVAMTNELDLVEAYNKEKDVEWYKANNNTNVSEIIIKEGEMFIAAPNEAHEPDNVCDEIEHEKVIFKIKI